MSTRNRVGLVFLALVVMISATTVATAQDGGPHRLGVPGVAVDSVPVAEAQANRDELISDVLQMWPPEPGQSNEQLATALRRASTEQLARTRQAKSFDEVNRILLGPGTNAFGSTSGDYVYTAVPPCRIFDTRNPGGGGVLAAGASRDFFVYGTTDIASQGGNPAGCPSPRGEPRAVHINLTAAPVTGPGNLRVYPQNLATPPSVSAVNFLASNIANALTVQTYYSLSAKEIRVLASNGSANVVADVLGYFYEADVNAGSGVTMTGNWVVAIQAAAANNFMWTHVSFPFLLASTPAAPAANFIPVGGASTANCPGTVTSPQAAPGQLCVYAENMGNATLECLAQGSSGACNAADRSGAIIALWSSAAGSAFGYGTWAVTAP